MRVKQQNGKKYLGLDTLPLKTALYLGTSLKKLRNNQGDEAYYFFVEFNKSFEMIPRDKLWNIIEELGTLDVYGVVVHRLYENVRAKIITSEGMSK